MDGFDGMIEINVCCALFEFFYSLLFFFFIWREGGGAGNSFLKGLVYTLPHNSTLIRITFLF